MVRVVQDNVATPIKRLPAWFRQEVPNAEKLRSMKTMFSSSKLHTVCESSRCPNLGQCWGQGVATFMILGDICTRACRFCAIKAGKPLEVDAQEPKQVAQAVKSLNLRYVVITSVARDDLPDEGAGHFAETINNIRLLSPKTKVEVLVPDFSNRLQCLQTVVEASPEVISHNIETVKRLSGEVRPQADYDRTLAVLKNFKTLNSGIYTKTSLMLGLGERDHEIEELMDDLVNIGCDILTIGQYLQPTQLKRHLPVQRFYTPSEFDYLKQKGERMGFKHVMSGPLVRSSYIAEEGYKGCIEKDSCR